MLTGHPVPPQFSAVKDTDEEIYWVGKPAFLPFILSGLPFLGLGLIWGSIDYFGFIRPILNTPNGPGPQMMGFMIPFFMLHLTPLWLGVLNFGRLFLVHGNTFYAYTNKRLMFRSGFWGTDFKALDFDRIADLEVNVGPIENMLQVGTIIARSPTLNTKRSLERLVAIQDPYEVFRKIKELMVNVKTDWNFPNAMRPDENPGYKTKYTGTK